VTQLNELIKNYDGSKRTKLHRLIKNLITKATTGDDVLDKNGNIVKEGTGDLTAILAIIDRLEGGRRSLALRLSSRLSRILRAMIGLLFSSGVPEMSRTCGWRSVYAHTPR
jgi:hypothetical protein